jgi:NitT/TauT family transport system permease protein
VSSALRKALAAGAAAVITLALWELGVRIYRVPEYLLPRPGVVLEKLVSTSSVQLDHLGATAATTIAGLVLAVLSGVLLALAVVYVKPLEAILVPAFAAFNGIPKIAVAPLLVTWFGLDALPKVLLAFLLGFFPVFVNAVSGLSDIEPDVLDMARLAGGTELRIFWKVRVMNALPYLTDALKVAFPLALVGSIVGEFVGGNHGIGYLVLSAQSSLDTPLVFASLVTITLFTTLGIGAVALIEEIFLGWRPSRRRNG